MSVAWSERTVRPRVAFTPKSGSAGSYSEAREAFSEELERHPSLLARLADIGTHWDEQNGTYRHTLAAHYGAEETDRVLRRLHQEVFVSWLSLPLRQQQADVTIYLRALGNKSEGFDYRKVGRSCVPRSATPPERDLFFLDLQLVQALRRY